MLKTGIKCAESLARMSKCLAEEQVRTGGHQLMGCGRMRDTSFAERRTQVGTVAVFEGSDGPSDQVPSPFGHGRTSNV